MERSLIYTPARCGAAPDDQWIIRASNKNTPGADFWDRTPSVGRLSDERRENRP